MLSTTRCIYIRMAFRCLTTRSCGLHSHCDSARHRLGVNPGDHLQLRCVRDPRSDLPSAGGRLLSLKTGRHAWSCRPACISVTYIATCSQHTVQHNNKVRFTGRTSARLHRRRRCCAATLAAAAAVGAARAQRDAQQRRQVGRAVLLHRISVSPGSAGSGKHLS